MSLLRIRFKLILKFCICIMPCDIVGKISVSIKWKKNGENLVDISQCAICSDLRSYDTEDSLVACLYEHSGAPAGLFLPVSAHPPGHI
jgi:hypothetical protein